MSKQVSGRRIFTKGWNHKNAVTIPEVSLKYTLVNLLRIDNILKFSTI